MLIENYTLNASNKTITIEGLYTIEQISLIVNVTTGTVLYDPAFGYKKLAIEVEQSGGNTIVTLNDSRSLQSNDDYLRILIDDFGTTTNSFQSIVNITRPNNTTAYTAGDVIGDTNGSAIITFSNIGSANGWIMLTRATLSIALTAIPSGMTGFNLHLFNAAPTAIADNDPREGNANDRTKLLRTISFYPSDQGSYLFAAASLAPNDLHFKLIGSSLFGLLETLGGYPSTAGTIYTLLLNSIGV